MVDRLLCAVFALAGSLGCLYVPPVTHRAGSQSVALVQAGPMDRQALRDHLGRPNILELREVYVWDWIANRGTVLLPLPAEIPITGGAFRVLARFEGDRAAQVQVDRGDARAVERTMPQNPFREVRKVVGGWELRLDERRWLWGRRAGEAGPEGRCDGGAPSLGRRGPVVYLVLEASEDGRFVLFGGPEGACLWSAAEGAMVARWGDGAGGLIAAAFSPDGAQVFLADALGLRLLDRATGRELWRHPMKAPPSGQTPRFTREGDFILLPGNELLLLETATGEAAGRIEARRLEPWFNIYDDLGWHHYRFRMEPGGLLVAEGPATVERWDLHRVAAAGREGRPARVKGNASEPALVAVELRPLPRVQAPPEVRDTEARSRP